MNRKQSIKWMLFLKKKIKESFRKLYYLDKVISFVYEKIK